MIGLMISHYKILEKLGEGGMGIVYRAHDTKLNRTVALKFLPPAGGEKEKARLIREAQAIAQLDHPNICTVHEIGDSEGMPYIAMAYIEGLTLKDKVENGPLPTGEVMDYAEHIARGLQSAHRKNITHRDIKSANIMITPDGQIKIMDFGLAKLAGRTQLTQEGSTAGTVMYMSPEQARGEDVDHRTDIWSFGVVLYEMLAGRLPYQSEYETAVVYSILNEDPRSVRDFKPDIPTELEAIVKKALQKDKTDRYQTIDELLLDLDVLSGTAVKKTTFPRTITDDPKAESMTQTDGILTRGSKSPLVETGAIATPGEDGTKRLTTFRWIATAAGVSAAALAITTSVGFITTRIYDLKLGIPADFIPSRTDYTITGVQALVPVFFYAFLGLLAYVILGYTWRLVCYGIRRAFGAGDTLDSFHRSTTGTLQRMIFGMSSTVLADLFFVTVVVTGLLVLMPFRELVTSMWSEGTEALSSANRLLHTRYTLVLTLLILALLLTWRSLVRNLRRRGPIETRALVSVWGSIIAILILVMLVAAPWRLLWNNYHERVLLDGERGYVLIETEADLIIYQTRTRSSVRYAKSENLNVQRLGSTGYLFEGPKTFDSARKMTEGTD
jgi:predicted Ser/Thr protein kinase